MYYSIQALPNMQIVLFQHQYYFWHNNIISVLFTEHGIARVVLNIMPAPDHIDRSLLNL